MLTKVLHTLRFRYCFVDGLQAAGFVVHLANTTAIKKYDRLKHSGDETDARYLAHLLRLSILPTGTIRPVKHREERDLARKRMQLVRSRGYVFVPDGEHLVPVAH